MTNLTIFFFLASRLSVLFTANEMEKKISAKERSASSSTPNQIIFESQFSERNGKLCQEERVCHAMKQQNLIKVVRSEAGTARLMTLTTVLCCSKVESCIYMNVVSERGGKTLAENQTRAMNQRPTFLLRCEGSEARKMRSKEMETRRNRKQEEKIPSLNNSFSEINPNESLRLCLVSYCFFRYWVIFCFGDN